MLSKNLRKALPHLLLLSSTMLFISPASGQSLERRECEMEAQQYASQRRAELDPSPAELAAAMNQIGGVGILYGPRRSFDMSWGLGGGRSSTINQCLQRPCSTLIHLLPGIPENAVDLNRTGSTCMYLSPAHRALWSRNAGRRWGERKY